MTLNETLKQLKALANEATRAHNTFSKRCTAPFAPIWINFMVSRQG